jgi:flagellar biosynthetic protein FliS
MLFDGCLRFTTAAKRAFEEEEFTKRNEDVNNNLIRAQNIVTELQSSLGHVCSLANYQEPSIDFTTMLCTSFNRPT